MKIIRARFICFVTLVLAACQVAAANPPFKVRACDYVPGKSMPARIAPGSAQPAPSSRPLPAVFHSSPVSQVTLDLQTGIFSQIVKAISQRYFSIDYNGVDWMAIQARYKNLIQNGLAQADFYRAMSQMVAELGDEVSAFISPLSPAEPPRVINEVINIGGAFSALNGEGKDIPVLSWIFSGSPADLAGLKNHDLLLKVDGLPFLDGSGKPRSLGAEGTTVTLTVQTPGQGPRDVKLVRRSFEPMPLVDSCMVAGTHIGYIRWLDLNDPSTIVQTAQELKKMSDPLPLQGLVVDLRMNQGRFLTDLEWLAGLFTRGELGRFVSQRDDSSPIPFTANPSPDFSAFQQLPLVVLQDQYTTAAVLSSGLLQLSGRARVVGLTAPGSMHAMYFESFQDGSILMLANKVFQPAGKAPDYWHRSGVIPDVVVAGRWDQFTEENDPYLARAVELLFQK